MFGKPQRYNLTKELWQEINYLAEDLSIIIKPPKKGLCVVIWNREDYLAKDYRQVSDHSTYTDIKKIKNFCLTLLKKVTQFLRDCTIKNLPQKRVEILFIYLLESLLSRQNVYPTQNSQKIT